MSNHWQSEHSPVQDTYKTAIFAQVWHKYSRIKGDLDSIQGPHYIKIKNTGSMANKGMFWLFQDHLESFQDPCLNSHKFNNFGSFWCITCQNKRQPLNFKFLNLSCLSKPIVATYEQIWCIFKNTQNDGNFHNRASSALKFLPEVITIGAHIVSKFQPCIPNISEVIAKCLHSSSFQDHLIFRPLYINLGQN